MERLSRVVGPVATNVHVLADSRSREAIAIDAAIPSIEWIAGELAAREWTLRLIVSTHGHWDHTGENAALEHLQIRMAVRVDEPWCDHQAGAVHHSSPVRRLEPAHRLNPIAAQKNLPAKHRPACPVHYHPVLKQNDVLHDR